ncbi:MAG: hypothetical protein A2W35_12090 [Chloroflexi bacterium RBG_16_57_11]|nr:MAG: hypothetical protein A2W35_12090 [Chloroflexi bacterium RBG_16_57_11]
MNRLSRSTALKTAAVLSFLSSTYSVIFALPMIAQGAMAVDQGGDSPPYFVLVLAVILGVVGIVAAYGCWKQMRWGVILTIIVNLLGGLSAAPGILFAPTTQLFVSASVSVAISIVIIVLCLWPDRKLATA